MAVLFRMVSVLAFALTLDVACAQSYPSKPIRIVIGFPPGGGIVGNGQMGTRDQGCEYTRGLI